MYAWSILRPGRLRDRNDVAGQVRHRDQRLELRRGRCAAPARTPRPGPTRSAVHARSVRPSRYARAFSSAGKRPVSAPASTAMFATASRSSIESASAPSPTNSSAAFVPPPTPISAMTARIRSLPVTNARFSPVNSTRIVARHRLPELAEREAVRDVGRAEARPERAERAVRAGVRVAARDDRAGDDPALLAEQRVLDPAAPLVVERHALRARPLLQPPLQLRRARVLRGHEVIGDHHDLRRVEDLRRRPSSPAAGTRPGR